MSRERVLTLALVVSALLGGSACGSPATPVRSAGAGQPGPARTAADGGAPEPSSTVVDADGVVRGSIDRAELDARDTRILDLLEELGTEEDGAFVPRAATAEQLDALLVVEAVPVHADDGTLAGHLAGHFLTVDERATLLPWAREVVDALTSG